MKKILLVSLLLTFSHAAVKIQHDGTTLGKPRVYHSFKGDKEVELTLVRLGKRSDKTVLISFKAPGHEMHKKSFIYDEKCETTRCKKIFYTQKGGSRINLISNDGYYAYGYHRQGFHALLSQEQKAIPLYYDKTISAKRSATNLFKNYQHLTFMDRTSSQVKSALKESLKALTQTCESTTTLDINSKAFKNKSMLLGLAKPMLDQLTKTCRDKDYKEAIQMIQKIRIEPSSTFKQMTLTKMNHLIIYLSPDIYNPTVTAKHAIDKL